MHSVISEIMYSYNSDVSVVVAMMVYVLTGEDITCFSFSSWSTLRLT